MSSVALAVYRQLLRILRTAQAEGLPVTGCVALPELTYVLCPNQHLKHLLRHNHDLNDAFQALQILPKQLKVLRACEEDSRQALQRWSSLQRHWCNQGPLSPLQQMAAAESAGWLLQSLVTEQAAQQMLCEGDIQELQQQSEAAVQKAQGQLDKLAASARATDPMAFGDAASPEQRLRQLEALRTVLFSEAKLRNTPFEWVYDGLAPALLPQVLERRKGMPLSLALVAAAVARRLAMPMQLLCAAEGPPATTASGPLLSHQLPPEVAARHLGGATSSTPLPDSWLLQLLPPAGFVWPQQTAVFLDVTRNGTLLDHASCAGRYPQLAAHLQQQMQQHVLPPQASSQIGWEPPEEVPAGVQQERPVRPPSVVAVWASLARCMVTAHQRRGESDLVAHWLYQLLALDTQAVEWDHVMQ